MLPMHTFLFIFHSLNICKPYHCCLSKHYSALRRRSYHWIFCNWIFLFRATVRIASIVSKLQVSYNRTHRKPMERKVYIAERDMCFMYLGLWSANVNEKHQLLTEKQLVLYCWRNRIWQRMHTEKLEVLRRKHCDSVRSILHTKIWVREILKWLPTKNDINKTQLLYDTFLPILHTKVLILEMFYEGLICLLG